MRICSLLPGATEILFALGLRDQVVGVTHECDYPPEARQKPVVVCSAIDPRRLSSSEIDREVGAVLAGGKQLYTLDERALRASAPDLIVTQGLCDVCALDYNQVVQAIRALPRAPEILSLNPGKLTDVLDDILRIGAATNQQHAAEALVQRLRARIQAVGERDTRRRPKVVCLEWFDPIYIAGHWVPEVIELAGGEDVLGRAGAPSFKTAWQEVVAAQPDALLLMPCGFDLRRTAREATPLRALEGWSELPAVRTSNVYALNGSAYFSRPGPRLIDGLEILASILHPGYAPDAPALSEAKKLLH
jgi:iron complex transport system substrate-binding protein